MRLDYELTARGILPSRERAKEKIKCGEVQVNGITCTKPSFEVCESDKIEFVGEALKYVGRGGLKLEKALEVFKIDVSGLNCLDIGASTGGFTDCMLKNGAEKVYAVEVGHGQLVDKLLSDNRVVNMENTDIRSVSADMFEKIPQFTCADVSFISLEHILPHIYRLTESNCVVLIKPQFEAGKSNIGKRGIVKSEKVHVQVIEKIISCSMGLGFSVKGLCSSAIRGGSGNVEYLLYLEKSGQSVTFDIKNIVSQAMRS